MTAYAVLGAGLMGRVIARHLLETDPAATVTLLDASADRLAGASAFVADARLAVEPLDVREHDRAARALQGHAVAIAALPHRFSLDALTAALAARVSIVDLVGSCPEKRRELDSRAHDAGIVIVPGCGVAPGLSNVLVARGVELLDEADDAMIYVGGIPRRREPPLEYQTVYSLESVFDACTRPARIWRERRETTVEPLTGLEQLRFPDPIGVLEAFYTDGLASLTLTMAGTIRGRLEEKTLRYPGFAEKVRFLRSCGMLDSEPILVGSVEIAPRDFLIQRLSPMLALGPEGDILVMRVIVRGRKAGERLEHIFDVIDYFDPRTGYTAMARTTGFPAATAARMIAAGRIPATGVRFPEEVFVGSCGREFLAALEEEGITVLSAG